MSGDAELLNLEGQERHHQAKGGASKKTTQPRNRQVTFPVYGSICGGHNYPHNEVQGTVTSEVISLLIMRPGYDCRNDGELLKLKQHAARKAACRLIPGRDALRPGFKAAMQPHVLLRGEHNAFLDNAVHPAGGGFRINQRWRELRLQHDELIA